MSWWDAQDGAVLGEVPVEYARSFLASLSQPSFEDVLKLMSAAISKKQSTYLRARRNCTFESLALPNGESVRTFEPSKELGKAELEPVYSFLEKFRVAYKEQHERRPTVGEVLASLNHAIDKSTEPLLSDGSLEGVHALWKDKRGTVELSEALAAIAAALRAHQKALVEDGEVIEIQEIRGEIEDGDDMGVGFVSSNADTVVVKDITREMRAIRKARGASPKLQQLLDAMAEYIRLHPERYDSKNEGGGTLKRITAKWKDPEGRKRVQHPKFGQGVVLQTIQARDTKLEIRFDQAGVKVLLERFLTYVDE